MKSLIATLSLLTIFSVHAGECTPAESLKVGQEMGKLQSSIDSNVKGPLNSFTRNIAFAVGPDAQGFLFCDFYKTTVNSIRSYMRDADKLIQQMENFADNNGSPELAQQLKDEINNLKTKNQGTVDFNEFTSKYPELTSVLSSCGNNTTTSQKQKIVQQFNTAYGKLHQVRFFYSGATMKKLLSQIGEYRINNCQ